MITRLRRWLDCWAADRQESWGHPPDVHRADETLVRWLRRANATLGARHWRRFRNR